MKAYVRKILLLSLTAISLLLAAGCSTPGQSGESGGFSDITATGMNVTEARPTDGSEAATGTEPVIDLIDIINGADSLDGLFEIYGEYAGSLDGAYSEAYSHNLLRVYKKAGALEFIKALAGRGGTYINVNSGYLVDEVFLQEDIPGVNEMTAEIEALRNKTDFSSDELNTLNEILVIAETIRRANTPVYAADKSDFTIWKDSKSVSLHEVEDTEKLLDMLGKPESENEEQLGPGADTFNGSFVKELSYDGIQLLLFSPKGDEKNYWIYNIIVTGKDFSTGKGIGVGSSLTELKKQYPDITMAKDGREDENNCAYEISMSYDCSYLTFEVQDGKVAGIDMLVEFP